MDHLLPSDSDPRVRRLYDHWRQLHPADGGMPGRQHLDPAAIVRLLPWVWMLDVHRQPLRFRYRLIGTEQVSMIGRELTGRWLDEAHEGFALAPRYPDYAAAAERGRVSYRRGPPALQTDKAHLVFERLLLPLARDGATVDILLGITVHHSAAPAFAPAWARA